MAGQISGEAPARSRRQKEQLCWRTRPKNNRKQAPRTIPASLRWPETSPETDTPADYSPEKTETSGQVNRDNSWGRWPEYTTRSEKNESPARETLNFYRKDDSPAAPGDPRPSRSQATLRWPLRRPVPLRQRTSLADPLEHPLSIARAYLRVVEHPPHKVEAIIHCFWDFTNKRPRIY